MIIELQEGQYSEIELAVKRELQQAVDSEYDGQLFCYGTATERIISVINQQLNTFDMTIK